MPIQHFDRSSCIPIGHSDLQYLYFMAFTTNPTAFNGNNTSTPKCDFMGYTTDPNHLMDITTHPQYYLMFTPNPLPRNHLSS